MNQQTDILNSINTKKTVFLQLLGGPGVGKSTIAADVFARLKREGIDTELVSEYAKQLVWEQSFNKMRNQIYIYGKQHNKQFFLNGKVDVVITDSPTILCSIYDEDRTKHLHELIISEYQKLNNITVFLERSSVYNPNGRTQTLEEAKAVDDRILEFLIKNKIEYIISPIGDEHVNVIVDLVKTKMKEINNDPF